MYVYIFLQLIVKTKLLVKENVIKSRDFQLHHGPEKREDNTFINFSRDYHNHIST